MNMVLKYFDILAAEKHLYMEFMGKDTAASEIERRHWDIHRDIQVELSRLKMQSFILCIEVLSH
jgi:hypothetical protein